MADGGEKELVGQLLQKTFCKQIFDWTESNPVAGGQLFRVVVPRAHFKLEASLSNLQIARSTPSIAIRECELQYVLFWGDYFNAYRKDVRDRVL